MCHRACIKAVRDHGASNNICRLVGAFLMKKKMFFRVGDTLSKERHLVGGSPQGTLLGNYMFVLTTDRLELPQNLDAGTTLNTPQLNQQLWDHL